MEKNKAGTRVGGRMKKQRPEKVLLGNWHLGKDLNGMRTQEHRPLEEGDSSQREEQFQRPKAGSHVLWEPYRPSGFSTVSDRKERGWG